MATPAQTGDSRKANMNNEESFHISQQIQADYTLDKAQRAANTAEQKNRSLNFEIGAANRKQRETEQQNRQLKAQLKQLTDAAAIRDKNAIRHSLVQEAIPNIEFLRQEIDRKYAARQVLRQQVTSWLDGKSAPHATLSIQQGNGDDTWLHFAWQASQAREQGDAATAQALQQRAAAHDSLLAATWEFLDALRSGRSAALTPQFQAMADLLDGRTCIAHVHRDLITGASTGLLGADIQRSTVGLLQRWHDAIAAAAGNDKRQAQLLRQMLLVIFPPAAAPDCYEAIRQIGSSEAQRFHATIAASWQRLQGIDRGLQQGAQQLPDDQGARMNAALLMRRVARIADADEARDEARLAYYLEAVQTAGDADSAQRAEELMRTQQRGEGTYGATIIGMLGQFDLRIEILRIIHASTTHFVAITHDAASFSQPPGFHGAAASAISSRSHYTRLAEERRTNELAAAGTLLQAHRHAKLRHQWACILATLKGMGLGAAVGGGVYLLCQGLLNDSNPLNPLAGIFNLIRLPWLADPLTGAAISGLITYRKFKSKLPEALLAPVVLDAKTDRQATLEDHARAAVLALTVQLEPLRQSIRQHAPT